MVRSADEIDDAQQERTLSGGMGGFGRPKVEIKQFGFSVKRELFTYRKELDACGVAPGVFAATRLCGVS
jgi:hypothetical protein